MARPALAMVSSGSAPDPIWLWHSQSSTAKSLAERFRHVWQHAPGLRLDLMSRPRQHPQRRKALGEPDRDPDKV